MPFKKIEDTKILPLNFCSHPEHNPPMHIALRPGTYEWICPACGNKQIVVVDGYRM